MKSFTILLLTLSALNCFGQQYSKSWLNVNYAGDSAAYHLLDIYLPEVEKPTYPVVVVIYGSAWFGNNLKGSDLPTLGKALLDAGFAVVMPNHRASFDAKFPAQIHDIKAVVRFIRANATSYQMDTSFVGITGSSSGGHLSALTGTSGSVKEFTVGSVTYDLEGTVGPHLSFSSSVDAVVDWFGPTDFQKMDSCGSSMAHNDATSPESSLIGGPIQENDDKCALANPITYVDANDPPFLILHGDEDPLVPHCNSELLYAALQKAGVSSQFVLVPGGQHGPGLFIDAYYNMMTDFFLNQLNVSKVDAGAANNPTKFSLLPNYPNPFNPSTTMTFTLPTQSFVTLEVFDSLGRPMSCLVSKELLPGTYSKKWNAEGLSSGTYFSRLQTESYSETQKIVLLK